MTFFDWKASYVTGVHRIDQEHKRLVRILNRLYEAMYAGEGRYILQEILEDLLAYTRVHFTTEEHLMGLSEYPDYPEHQKIHQKMAENVERLYKEFQEQKLHSPVQISNFLKNWLNRHILQTDMKMARHLRAKGIR